jgi:acyl-CoA thioester hydrolase
MPDQSITRALFRYWKTIEVRWGDMDAQGHVNNTAYFIYCESARVELLRRIGFKGKQTGLTEGPALVHAACDFRRQVIYPATLDIGIRVEKIGQRSFQMEYGLFLHDSDELAAIATSINAWVHYVEEHAVDLPEEIRSALAEYR